MLYKNNDTYIRSKVVTGLLNEYVYTLPFFIELIFSILSYKK